MENVNFSFKCTECNKDLQCESMNLSNRLEIITFDIERCDCHDEDLIQEGKDIGSET